MFYLGIKSGLGNQMFQYAFGKAISIENNIPMSLDISAYGRQFERDTPRNFTLNHFSITAPIASIEETKKFHTKFAVFKRRLKNKLLPLVNYEYHPSELKVKDGQYKEGFWQTEKYFEKHGDIIRKEFTLKKPLGTQASNALKEIEQKKGEGFETILIHVRRGDYVTNKHSVALLGVLEPEYFIKSLEIVCEEIDKKYSNSDKKNPPKHIFFATEDIDWVKNNIKPNLNYSFISRPGIEDYEEIILMSNCDHFIISNSSFSWWAAWLGINPNKTVVAPKKWIMNPKVNTTDATPPSWLRI